ncbi:hypothetical protein [Odoribacter sp. Z80]|uniref:hypothetical protein n=1 Tax=Odoribacter sp. Z80 TaxID=2304575 RepID=UPI001379E1F2|nr:hypothetical protein [Odoribacter sp. Z80]
MKRIKIIWIFLLLAGFWGACENEPEFPDPKFDSSATSEYTVRRDTADVFYLSCRMEVPNGIDYVEVMDVSDNYKVLERLEQYRGMTRLEFRYPVDLTSFEQDTLLGFVVKICDVKQRTYNKAFQVEVKKRSVPEIHFTNGEYISAMLPFIALQASFSTGMVPIRNIVVKLDGQVKKTIKPERDTCDYVISNLILQGLSEMRPYVLELVLEDVQGRQAVAQQHVYRISKIEKPVKILVAGSMEGEIVLDYDEEERLEGIELLGQFRMRLIYNESGDRIIRIEEEEYGNYSDRINYDFEYDESGLLVSAKETGYSSAMASAIEYENDARNKRLKQFVSGAALLENIAYEEGFSSGEYIYSEEWPATIQNVYSGIRLRMTGYHPVLIPTYLEELPYPLMRVMRWPQLFHDLFLTQYVHMKTVNYLDENQVKYFYTYSMDDKGRLSEWQRLYTDIERVDYYKFIYR